jgi:adenine-specific DNA-methyltransferase
MALEASVGVKISYMGTKHDLAPAVCDVIRHTQKGTMLDAFAGMCSVGEHMAPTRQVWSNDVQVFAAEVARALFTSRDEPIDPILTADIHFDTFEKHRHFLTNANRRSIEAEDTLLEASNFEIFVKRKKTLWRMRTLELASARRHNGNLFTSIYSDSYFGVRQGIEADSIIRAIRTAHHTGAIADDHRRWLTLGLGRALLKIANSTGHFAQYLKPQRTSYRRFLSQRRRSLWSEWLSSCGDLHAVGTADWRRLNRCFNQDSLLLLPSLRRNAEPVAVIYADPPYTDDQYSRYYHIFETLVLYDYPPTSGAGLYRPNRFSSPFSLKSKAIQAFDTLVKAAANCGADLVLSYPTNGLVYESGANPKQLLARHYRKTECCYSLPHTHSTFGASKGSARSNVTERIYWARS